MICSNLVSRQGQSTINMKIVNIDGNLLDTDADVIMHQVNCQGAMNSGVAKAIREKWPIVYEKYKNACDGLKGNPSSLLGKILPVKSDGVFIVNMFAQDKYGYDGYRYTSYDALDICIKKTASWCRDGNVKKIALPYHMSSDRGGANWNIVLEMIKQHFNDLDITVEIWKL